MGIPTSATLFVREVWGKPLEDFLLEDSEELTAFFVSLYPSRWRLTKWGWGDASREAPMQQLTPRNLTDH